MPESPAEQVRELVQRIVDGIGLRGYGQRDPLVEYKKESFALFQDMRERIEEEIVRYLWFLRPVVERESGEPTVAVPVRPAPKSVKSADARSPSRAALTAVIIPPAVPP